MNGKKHDFVTAYTWLFGATKRNAEQVYRTANSDYINAIIRGFMRNASACAYTD